MSKLELIYTCCTQEIVKEMSYFWQGYDIPDKKLSIDTDQLQGMLIYIVSRLDYHQILTEVKICDTFLPKNVKKSSRTLYLEMLGSSCEFILEQDLIAEQKRALEEQAQKQMFSDEVGSPSKSFEELPFGVSLKSGS